MAPALTYLQLLLLLRRWAWVDRLQIALLLLLLRRQRWRLMVPHQVLRQRWCLTDRLTVLLLLLQRRRWRQRLQRLHRRLKHPHMPLCSAQMQTWTQAQTPLMSCCYRI
jgi:hypothetical protein